MVVKEDELAWVSNKKLILQLDRKRWLDIIEMFYIDFQESKDQDTKRFLKDQMRFCGEQSQEIKKQLALIK